MEIALLNLYIQWQAYLYFGGGANAPEHCAGGAREANGAVGSELQAAFGLPLWPSCSKMKSLRILGAWQGWHRGQRGVTRGSNLWT